MIDRPPVHVLLVEDDPLVRLVAAEVLVGAGYALTEAADAASALAYLGRGNVPDVVVTDVRMPGTVDGLELAQIIAARWPHIGIVVVSAHAFPRPGELPPGAAFMSKPHTPGMLVRRVAELVVEREIADAAG